MEEAMILTLSGLRTEQTEESLETSVQCIK